MASNRFGIDLGGIYRDVEAIKGARTRNKMAGMELATAERLEEERPARELATKNRNMMVSDLRAGSVSGDQSSIDKFRSMFPDEFQQFITSTNDMDEGQRKKVKDNIETMANYSATILNAKPEKRESLYQSLRASLPIESQKKMPDNYDENFLTMSLGKFKGMDQYLENPKAITLGGEDILYKGGREIERADVPAKSSSPLVSVNTGGDKKESEKLAELRVKRLDEIQQKAIAAEEQIESINQIKAIDLETGLGVETRGQIAKVWDSLGGDGKALTGVDPSDVQKFKAVATKQVLDIMASQKGPQTDQDAARIEKAVANLGNTKDANNFVMDAAISIANRKIEQSAFMERYLEQNNTMKGADGAWRDFKVKTPMVSDVIKDPNSGAPVFFYQFKEKMARRNYSEQDIVEAWRRMNAGGQ